MVREQLKNIGNLIVASLYFLAAHLYDGICFAVSNLVSYPEALLIMTATLLFISILLVFLHQKLNERFGWDILGMNEINRLAHIENIPTHQYFKRLMRWSLSKGHWWVFFIGSATVGPPVIALLLQQPNNLKSLWFYLVTGTLISVFTWVTIWSGIGKFI